MVFVLICICFYLIGSIPTAYILVRSRYKKNLIKEGSGNIGARNTYDVTNSKLDGIIVLIIDFLKGLLPTFWFLYYTEFTPALILITSICLLIGHNYSVWIKFKGGRGLATAAGIMVLINFTLVLLWLLFYFVADKIVSNAHIASVIALIILPILVLIFSDVIITFNNSPLLKIQNQIQFLFSFCSSICIIVLLKHISPILEIYKKSKIK